MSGAPPPLVPFTVRQEADGTIVYTLPSRDEQIRRLLGQDAWQRGRRGDWLWILLCVPLAVFGQPLILLIFIMHRIWRSAGRDSLLLRRGWVGVRRVLWPFCWTAWCALPTPPRLVVRDRNLDITDEGLDAQYELHLIGSQRRSLCLEWWGCQDDLQALARDLANRWVAQTVGVEFEGSIDSSEREREPCVNRVRVHQRGEQTTITITMYPDHRSDWIMDAIGGTFFIVLGIGLAVGLGLLFREERKGGLGGLPCLVVAFPLPIACWGIWTLRPVANLAHRHIIRIRPGELTHEFRTLRRVTIRKYASAQALLDELSSGPIRPWITCPEWGWVFYQIRQTARRAGGIPETVDDRIFRR